MSTTALSEDQTFGTFAPRGLAALILHACHRIPASWPAARTLNKLLRGLIKRPARQFDVEVAGLKLRLRTAGNYCEKRQLFEPQFYDVQEISWLCNALNKGGVFMDIGGNIGLYSLHIGHNCPAARIITVEPNEALSSRMLFNAATNRIDIELAPIALSDYNGTGYLDLSSQQQGENSLNTSSQSGNKVQVSTLLELCNANQVNRIDAMKIDIEGHEHLVLSHFFAHAPQTLWPGVIVIEHVHDATHIVSRLQAEFGYRIETQTSRNVLLSAKSS